MKNSNAPERGIEMKIGTIVMLVLGFASPLLADPFPLLATFDGTVHGHFSYTPGAPTSGATLDFVWNGQPYTAANASAIATVDELAGSLILLSSSEIAGLVNQKAALVFQGGPGALGCRIATDCLGLAPVPAALPSNFAGFWLKEFQIRSLSDFWGTDYPRYPPGSFSAPFAITDLQVANPLQTNSAAAPIPEPGTLTLLLVAIGGFALYRSMTASA